MDYLGVYRKVFAEESSYNASSLFQEENYLYVMRFVRPRVAQFNSVVDLGTGRGVLLAHLLQVLKPSQILSCDLDKFHEFPVEFMKLDLTRDLHLLAGRFFDLATCTDVLEHLESFSLEYVLSNLSGLANWFVFTIANHDSFSNEGVQLHLTRESISFWEGKLAKFFTIVDLQVLKSGFLFGFVLTPKTY